LVSSQEAKCGGCTNVHGFTTKTHGCRATYYEFTMTKAKTKKKKKKNLEWLEREKWCRTKGLQWAPKRGRKHDEAKAKEY